MKKFVILIFAVLLTVFSFVSCGSKSEMGINDASGYGLKSPEASEQKSPDTDPSAEDGSEKSTDKKIIKTYSISIETLEYDKSMSDIKSLVSSYGGYAESSEEGNSSIQYGYSSRTRTADYLLRIPAEKLDNFVTDLSKTGNVVNSKLSTSDVTESYYGISDMLDSLITQRERILALMEKAENLSDLIVLDDKLTQVTAQINSLNRQLSSYDKSVTYSYVYLYLYEVKEYKPSEEISFFGRIGNAFVNGFGSFFEFMGDVLVGIVWIIPFAILAAVIIVIVIVCTKKKRKKKSKESTEKP